MADKEQHIESESLGDALRGLYPGRFSETMQITLMPDQGWFNKTYLLKDVYNKSLVLRTRVATAEQQSQHAAGEHWSPYFKEAWAIQTAHMGVPVAAIDGNDCGYFYLKSATENDLPELCAYLLQEYLPSDSAASVIPESNRLGFYEHIGMVARQVNATPVVGFGDTFDAITGGFTHDSWHSYITTEVEQFSQQRKRFETLLPGTVLDLACKRLLDTTTLCHSATLYHLDFIKNWNNILVDEYECITGIIDWEFAGAGPGTHCELASTLYIFYRDNASKFERRKEFNALLSGYGISLRAYAANFRYDIESLMIRHALNALSKYLRLVEAKDLDSQPWRKVHAVRAVALMKEILQRKPLSVYVPNPSIQSILAA